MKAFNLARNSLIFLIFLCFSVTSIAQVNIGIIGGTNYVKDIFYESNLPISAGKSYGVKARLPLKNKFELEVAALRTAYGLGYHFWCGTNWNDPKRVINSYNLELQTSLKYHLRYTKKLRPYVSAGVTQLYEYNNLKYGQVPYELAYEQIWGNGGIRGSKYNIALYGSAGINFKLGNHLNLNIETAIRNVAFAKKNLASKSIFMPNFGLNYRLK